MEVLTVIIIILVIFNLYLLFWIDNRLKELKRNTCKHLDNVRVRKYFDIEGRPAQDVRCTCGYKKNGHVDVNPQEWEESLVIKKDGTIIFYDK